MSTVIEVSNLWFDFSPHAKSKENWVLKDLNLQISAGEWVSIVGDNGSGKSTLARLLNGLFLPVEGEVKVGGLSTRSEEDLWEIRRRVGMIFQNPDHQIVAPTVRDDVAFGLENLGIPREEMIQRIEEALTIVGLETLADEPPHHLSGGQKQRLAIAGVLAMKPDVIILDEATSMLDPQGRNEILQVIQTLHSSGTTIVQITHTAREIFLADRIIVLANGRKQGEVRAKEIYKQWIKLKEWGIELPLELEVYQALQSLGYPLKEPIEDQEDLVNEICRLLSTM